MQALSQLSYTPTRERALYEKNGVRVDFLPQVRARPQKFDSDPNFLTPIFSDLERLACSIAYFLQAPTRWPVILLSISNFCPPMSPARRSSLSTVERVTRAVPVPRMSTLGHDTSQV